MEALSCREQHIIRELLSTGYAHAARSLATLVNQPVSAEIMLFTVSRIGVSEAIYYPEGNATLILTDIIGEVGGRSYLLLSEPECVALFGMCLPATGTERQHAGLGEELLKEIDNIVSAAMITKLSEALDVRIFGGVPHAFTSSAVSIKAKIKEDMAHQKSDGLLMVSARFLFETDASLQPQFFWSLPPEFIQKLADYTRLVP